MQPAQERGFCSSDALTPPMPPHAPQEVQVDVASGRVLGASSLDASLAETVAAEQGLQVRAPSDWDVCGWLASG